MKRFYLHKLGCPKNDVDADYIAGFLHEHGYQAATDPDEADILIVNSCGFIAPAKEESIGAVLELAELKKRAGDKKLIITGCLSQRYAKELGRDIPELDGIFGINDFMQMTPLLDGSQERIISASSPGGRYSEFAFGRAVDARQPFAYLKISDGCDNRCAYCAIPDIRGGFRSRMIESIVEEARWLLDAGKTELILVSQDATAYGKDIYGQVRLIDLLAALTALPGDFWVRVMYMHPARVTAELVDYMIDNDAICNYFDVPIQHICDDVLKAMGRGIDRSRIEWMIGMIRSSDRRVAIRTNVIVGFPGETKEHFEELCAFIEGMRFERLGAFFFSPEEGTRAVDMAGQIDERTKEERYHRVMALQRDIAFDYNEDDIDTSVEVIVDDYDTEKKTATARTRFDAPDIDQTVRVRTKSVTPGQVIRVRISGWDGYDLLGAREEP